MAGRTARRGSGRRISPAQQAERDAKREAILGSLADGIDSLCSSAEWQRYLSFQGKFRRYSFANTMLILTQCPAATRVAPYGTAERGTGWAGMGRQVRKGETSIRIWAPTTGRKAEADEVKPEGEGQAKDDEKPLRPQRFTLVPVFDVSQTDGEPLPEPVKLLEGEDELGMLGKLTGVAESIGYAVKFAPEIDGYAGANGLCEYGSRTLTVATEGRSPLQQVKSLTHEIAHATLHEPDAKGQQEASRGVIELEAESTAYVVTQELGLDTSDYSFGYVAGWAGGDPDETRAKIKASGRNVQRAAKAIMDELEKQAEPVAEADGQADELVTEPQPVAVPAPREPVAEVQAEEAELEMAG